MLPNEVDRSSPISPVCAMNVTSFLIELDPFYAVSPDDTRLHTPELMIMRNQPLHYQYQKDYVTARYTIDEHRGDDDKDDDADETGSLSSLSTKGLDEDDLHGQVECDCNKMKKVVILPIHSRESLYDRRSIFSHYWDTTGQQPMEMLRDQGNMHRSKSNTHLDREAGQVDDGGHRCPPVHSTSSESLPSVSYPSLGSSPSRRSIFGLDGCDVGQDHPSQSQRNCSSSSFRSLPNDSCASLTPLPVLERRTQSISSLRRNNKPRMSSCLRKKKLNAILADASRVVSMDSLPSTHSTLSAASVSFDERVRIYTFEPPQENWSDGSWKKIFGL